MLLVGSGLHLCSWLPLRVLFVIRSYGYEYIIIVISSSNNTTSSSSDSNSGSSSSGGNPECRSFYSGWCHWNFSLT